MRLDRPRRIGCGGAGTTAQRGYARLAIRRSANEAGGNAAEELCARVPAEAARAANTGLLRPSHSWAADLFTGWDRIAREMMGVLRSQAAPDEHDP